MTYDWNAAGQEVDALAIRAQAGDRDALAELVERYRPLIRSSARAVYWEHDILCSKEDAIQEATAVFIRSVEDYQPERGAFGPFIKRLLWWRLARRYRQERQSIHARPLDDDLVRALENDGRLTTWDPDDVEERGDLHEALSQLPPLERDVLALRYWQDRSTAEIAVEIGMTQRGVNQARRRAEARLRATLEGRAPARGRQRRRARRAPASRV